MSEDDVNARLAAANPRPGIDPETENRLLRQRIRELEESLHELTVSAREAEKRAACADVIVLPVDGGAPGEIDVFSDGHLHHYVPASIVADRAAVLREALDAIPQTICTGGPNGRHDPGCDDPTCPLLLVNNAIQALLDRPR